MDSSLTLTTVDIRPAINGFQAPMVQWYWDIVRVRYMDVLGSLKLCSSRLQANEIHITALD